MSDELSKAVDKALIDALPQGVKEAIDHLLSLGEKPGLILNRIKRQSGYMSCIYTAAEAYVEQKTKAH